MATSYKDYPLEQVPATSTLLYTVPSVASSHIIYAVVHNEGTSTVTLTLNIVQNGASVSVANQYYKKDIWPNETLSIPIVGRVLSTGDTVYALASSASSLNLNLGIKELTN
jgi:hypothetical protein